MHFTTPAGAGPPLGPGYHRRISSNAASSDLASGSTSRLLAAAWMALAVGIVALYAHRFALRGWIPHDEGTIALSAERVLDGDLPHRDFDEGYTGGLSYLHAAAFSAGGVTLVSLRWLLYGAFLLFSAAVFALGRRLGPPWLACLLVLAAAAWSVPNYFASLPSWYNLFLATFAALALARSIEREDRAPLWTFVAGLCAGTSVLIKQVGLYAVAGGVLFLVYREQRAASSASASPARRSGVFLAVKGLGALGFVVLLLAVFGRRGEPMDVVEFVLPGALLAAFLVRDDALHARGSAADRFRSLFRRTGPFLAGAALPLLAFGAAFWAAGAWRPLVHDVLVRGLDPAKHAESSATPASALLPALPFALLLLFPGLIPKHREKLVAAVLAIVLAAALVFASQIDVYQAVWSAARSLPLAVAAATLALLLRTSKSSLPDEKARERVFLLASMTVLVGLVQFPFPSPIYYCYAAPLALLAAAALVRADPRSPRAVHAVILVFVTAFAVLWMNRGYVFQLGRYYEPYDALSRLDLPRAGLRVPARDEADYEGLVSAVLSRSTPDSLYAGPDCPEVYFLSGRRNPTRSFFDYQGELYDRPHELLHRLESRGVTAVVINAKPAFSRPYGPGFLDAIRSRFPESREFGRFTLYWRPGPSGPLAYNSAP